VAVRTRDFCIPPHTTHTMVHDAPQFYKGTRSSISWICIPRCELRVLLGRGRIARVTCRFCEHHECVHRNGARPGGVRASYGERDSRGEDEGSEVSNFPTSACGDLLPKDVPLVLHLRLLSPTKVAADCFPMAYQWVYDNPTRNILPARRPVPRF